MFHVKQFIGIKKRDAAPGVPLVFLPVQALYFAF